MATRTPNHDHDHDPNDLTDRGLQFDVVTLMQRRHALKLFVGGAALALVGCSDNNNSSSTPTTGANAQATTGGAGTTPTSVASTASGATTGATATASRAVSTATALVSPIPTGITPASGCTTDIPEETAGPYPGDGSNGPNVLTQSGIVRSDIRSSVGTSTTTAKGVPLTMALTIVDTANGCRPMEGAAVYAWHCDMAGLYSMYSQGVTNENYLRGVQVANANGVVTFQSIFPGAYLGRWPHVHFEVYPSLDKATSSVNKICTSQLAFPEATCNQVYATSGYEQSAINMPRTTLASDGIFRDGYDLQMAVMSGNVSSGYVATLLVGV